MDQTIQQCKNKIPAYWLIQLVSIVLLLNVVQCKCKEGVEDPELSLEVDKNNLIGNDKTVQATLKNSKEATADFSQYGLLAELKQGKGKVECGGTELTIGTAQDLKKLLGVDELGKGSKDFEITVEPDAGVAEFEIALSVVDLDDPNKTVSESVTVKWRVGANLLIDTSTSKLSVKGGGNKATIVIKNDGTDATSAGDVVLVIQKTGNGDAELDHTSLTGGTAKTGAAIDIVQVELTQINSGGTSTVEIPITPGATSADTEFEVSLLYKGKPVGSVSETISWKEDVQLSIDTSASKLSVKGGGNMVTIVIKNDGTDTAVAHNAVLVIQKTAGDAELDHTSLTGDTAKTGAAIDIVQVELTQINSGGTSTIEIPIKAGATSADTEFEVSLLYKTPVPSATATIKWTP